MDEEVKTCLFQIYKEVIIKGEGVNMLKWQNIANFLGERFSREISTSSCRQVVLENINELNDSPQMINFQPEIKCSTKPEKSVIYDFEEPMVTNLDEYSVQGHTRKEIERNSNNTFSTDGLTDSISVHRHSIKQEFTASEDSDHVELDEIIPLEDEQSPTWNLSETKTCKFNSCENTFVSSTNNRHTATLKQKFGDSAPTHWTNDMENHLLLTHFGSSGWKDTADNMNKTFDLKLSVRSCRSKMERLRTFYLDELGKLKERKIKWNTMMTVDMLQSSMKEERINAD
jgi:hypothetical protein